MEMSMKGILDRKNRKIKDIETGNQIDYLEKEGK